MPWGDFKLSQLELDQQNIRTGDQPDQRAALHALIADQNQKLDPPYYANGHRLYRNTYKHADHAKIASLAVTISQPWIASYDNAPEVYDLYAKFRQQTFGLSYSANARHDGT